eukprot:167809_1
MTDPNNKKTKNKNKVDYNSVECAKRSIIAYNKLLATNNDKLNSLINIPISVCFIGWTIWEVQDLALGDLHSWSKEFGGILSWDMSYAYAYKIIKPLIQVIIYLHENNILHRDLKPQNVLYYPGWNIKITDFGICKNTNPYI